MRVVWILGAGFSRSLGGPLLRDLFSAGSWARILAAYQGTHRSIFNPPAAEVREIFQHHGPGAKDVQSRRWDDAEEFLEALDAGAFHPEGSPSAKLVQDLLGGSVTPARAAASARRLLAAECCAFLSRADTNSERWEPYKRWLSQLGASDTIVSFNYDMVVERTAATMGTHPLHVVAPAVENPPDGKPCLLKLHGSVSWEFHKSTITIRDDEEYALGCPDDHLVIASPGPTKQGVAARLERLWVFAEAALKKADAVVFMGYRFPPSDSTARRRLIGAIAGNNVPTLRLHTVLGPNRGEPDTVRIQNLLLHAVNRGSRRDLHSREAAFMNPTKVWTLDVHPLWTQDFMDVVAPQRVYQAENFPRA